MWIIIHVTFGGKFSTTSGQTCAPTMKSNFTQFQFVMIFHLIGRFYVFAIIIVEAVPRWMWKIFKSGKVSLWTTRWNTTPNSTESHRIRTQSDSIFFFSTQKLLKLIEFDFSCSFFRLFKPENDVGCERIVANVTKISMYVCMCVFTCVAFTGVIVDKGWTKNVRQFFIR